MFHRTTCYRCGHVFEGVQEEPKQNAIQVSVARDDRRRTPRFNVWEKGEVRAQETGVSYEVHVQNISVGGLLFDAGRPYTPGEHVVLRIMLEGRAYAVEGVVRQSKKLVNNRLQFETGVQFSNPDPALVEHVAGWQQGQTLSPAA
jgi:hypothetical protein